MAWDKWTQMDNNHRITERPGLEQTWKIIWFQQWTKQVLLSQQHPGWSCKQLQEQWGNEGGIPFLYIPSLLENFDALMSHGKHLCWQGERPGWSRGGTEHRVEQWQQFLLMCFRKTFFFPNPNLILIYILKHEDISHPIFLLSEGWVLFWVDFCLNLSCSNSSCIFYYWHRLRHWILALGNTPWQAALWINKGETIPCFLWKAMLKLHS